MLAAEEQLLSQDEVMPYLDESVQDEEQRIPTDRVTNHNRIHALNALYFEMLNGYQVNISSKDFTPILFLPFKPIQFNKNVLRRYWWIIRTYLTDESLVLALDEYFLTLSSAASPATTRAESPRHEDITASAIKVCDTEDGPEADRGEPPSGWREIWRYDVPRGLKD